MCLHSSFPLRKAEEPDGHHTRSSTIRPIFTVLGCFFITLLVLLNYFRYSNYRDPTSFFFDPSRGYQKIYSAHRIQEADAFVQSASLLKHGLRIPTRRPVMCIGVAAVTRKGEQYVRHTVGSLLEGLSEEERDSIHFTMFIDHTNVSQHPIYAEKWTETLPNKILEYREKDVGKVEEWIEDGNYQFKSVFDYLYLLEDCHTTGAKYVAMIEGDTLAVKGWYPRVLEALRDVEEKMQTRPGQKWIYLRLFYSEHLFGWNKEDWRTYSFWSFHAWMAITTCFLVAQNSSKKVEHFLPNPTILVISGVCIPASIALFFAYGRNAIWPLTSGVHEMNKFGCCAQGLVFPQHMVPAILEKITLMPNQMLDMMMESASNDEGWARWAPAPALLQYIGSVSLKGEGLDDKAKHLWNFGFELYGQSGLG